MNVAVTSETVVDTVSVDEGDMEMVKGKKLGELQHRLYMALEWTGEHEHVCSGH